jgi:hypothetical protein
MKLPSFFLLALLLAVPAFAQYMPSPSDPQAPVEIEKYRGNFADFEHVQFLCSSDTSGDYISNALCTAAENAVRSGARDAGLSFREGTNRESDDTFMIYVQITSAGTAPRGMAVRLEASRYYEKAIDRAVRSTTPAFHPRPGKLVMWEETITGVGQGDSLEDPMRRRVRHLLQGFFTMVERQKD